MKEQKRKRNIDPTTLYYLQPNGKWKLNGDRRNNKGRTMSELSKMQGAQIDMTKDESK